MPLTFITGPVRSGKSRLAERLARETLCRVTYLATAARDASDPQWNTGLSHHARTRPSQWQTLETADLSHEALLAIFAQKNDAQTLLLDPSTRGSRHASRTKWNVCGAHTAMSNGN